MKACRGLLRSSTLSNDPAMAGHRVVRFTAGSCPRIPRGLSIAWLLMALFSSGKGLAAELKVPGDYGTITTALAAAGEGDTIRVAGGTYSAATGESFPLRLDKAMTLEGDAANTPHLQGDGSSTVVLIESGGVTLRGFRITDGMGSEGINHMDGGGVCIFVGPGETDPVTIQGCVIEDNACPSDETYDGCGGGLYGGGTYCTCFEIRILNCLIRENRVRGQGGGVFCALLSNVKVKDTLIERNTADDHGGGVFVDVFALLDMTNTYLILNNCPGDRAKANWGGKGGGLACESFGVFSARDCLFSQNTAKYYGGGIFTRGGLFAGEDLCDGAARFPLVAKSRLEENHADVAGGGAYVASSAVLSFSDTTFYWNDANQVDGNGGAVFVNGGETGGGIVDFNDGCLLEGNESARHGGGVYLGQGALGTFDSTQLVGNTSLLDGGAVYLEGGADGALTNCLVAYNNSARRHGGGFCVGPQAGLDLVHCSIVGNFSPHQRSGLYLDPNAAADITDSILWRNAGGSIEANGAAFNIATSLNEDGADPNHGVLCCDPRYVGWGGRTEICVDASRPVPGDGTAQRPYRDLQCALNGFDFRLGTDSPCRGMAGGGGNMGCDTGVSADTGGNVTALLHLLAGPCDIRGRNIIFIKGIQGNDPNTSVIRHAVLGHIEPADINGVTITAEEIFGGITTRADVNFVDCKLVGNTALADGGGLYVADGNCVMTNDLVAANVCRSGSGGGIYLSPQTGLELRSSHVEENLCQGAKGGGIYAATDTISSVSDSTILANDSGTYGGGLFLEKDTVSAIVRSEILSNLAHQGAGIYVSGQLGVIDSTISSNSTQTRGTWHARKGGGIYVSGTADVHISHSVLSSNYAYYSGGGVLDAGKTRIEDESQVLENRADYGGGVHIDGAGALYAEESFFRKNKADVNGGGMYVNPQRAPQFVRCEFTENSAQNGGAGILYEGSQTAFEDCTFADNRADPYDGGCFYLQSTGTRFLRCQFRQCSAKRAGGTGLLWTGDASLFNECYVEGSSAATSGGAFCIDQSAQPVFWEVQVADSWATGNGGGIAIIGTSKPKFSGVTISRCQAVNGGGVYAGGQSSSIFQECKFWDNLALSPTISADGGGAFFTEEANGWLVRCVFQGNSATDDGGGIAAAGTAKMDLRNTLFTVNTAINTGGGAYFTSTSAGAFTNCTIVSNRANGDNGGGGIYLDPTSRVNVDSSIICQNSPDGIRQGANPIVSYSCVQELWPGPGNRLCDDGCTLDPNTFEPPDGSPCIDAGNDDPNMNDGCQPPGKDDLRNDMGITGGPDNCVYAPPPEPNLAGWWTFDRIVGIWILDSSGHSHHAALVNGPTSVPGRWWRGKALDFDGIDDYVEAIIDVSEKTYAVSLWFNTTSADSGIFSVTDAANSRDRDIYLRSGDVRARVWSNQAIGTTGVNYADGNWHCVVHTYDAEQGGQKLYVDGELKASGSKSFSDFYWQTEVRIGYSGDASQPYFKGQLDEVRVYSRSLSALEVQSLVNP